VRRYLLNPLPLSGKNQTMDRTNLPKALLFDFGGVLLNLDEEKTWNGLREILDPAKSGDVWELVFHPFERGEISEDAFFNRLQRRSTTVLQGDLYVRIWNAMLLDLPESRIAMLELLRDSFDLYLLSNTNITHLRKVRLMLEKKGLWTRFESCFKGMFFSHELQMRKPEERIYREVLEIIRMDARDCLFIDDKMENTQAAQATGMQVYTHDPLSEIGLVLPDLLASYKA